MSWPQLHGILTSECIDIDVLDSMMLTLFLKSALIPVLVPFLHGNLYTTELAIQNNIFDSMNRL